jgi:hypothetical protein
MKFPTLKALRVITTKSEDYRLLFIRSKSLVNPQLWTNIGGVVAVDTNYDFGYHISVAYVFNKTTKVESVRYTAYYSCPASVKKAKATGMHVENLGIYSKAADARKSLVSHYAKNYNKDIL